MIITTRQGTMEEIFVLGKWLQNRSRGEHSFKFNIIDVTEVQNIRKDAKFPSWLAEELLVAHKNPEHLKRRYSRRDKKELRDYLDGEVFPQLTTVLDKNNRRGDFGEIISSLILRDIYQLETALIKLRYKLNRKKSSFGIDVFGVQSDEDGKVSGLYICETKTKITYDKQIGVKAHQSLFINETSSINTIADFMSELYYSEGNYDLSDQFDEIVLNNAQFPTDYHIFLVHEKNKWKEDILSVLNDLQDLEQDFTINVLLIDDLDHLSDHSFSLISDVGEEIVYGAK